MKQLVVGILALLLACGGSGDATGPQAASVTGVFGDSGSVLTGGTLAIGFTVLGADGLPARGVKVTWTVAPASAANVTSTQASDTVGAVATSVHVGSTVGPFTVTANVTGTTPVTFHLTALDPCKYLAPYALGDTVNGSLALTDCHIAIGLNSYYYDFYQITLPAGQQGIRIKESSSGANKIDPYLELYRQTGQQVGFNDDSLQVQDQNSQLDMILASGGTFIIGATSYDPDTVGPYVLTSANWQPSIAGCRDVWVTPGVAVTDTIRSTDCADSVGNYADIVLLFMSASDTIKVAERSTAFNPVLTLFAPNFQLQRYDSVAANDDSASGNPNAYLSYPVATTGFYLLRIGTTAAHDSGEYNLAFSPSTLGPSAARGASFDRAVPLLPWPMRRWKKPS
jgi:hypothetical protein